MLNPLRALTLGGLLLFSTLGHAAPAAPDALRIGYQKGSVSMVLAKSHQLLEQRYPQTHISWIEFPAGPQMLEALNVGSIDIGSTGDIPPIFAQAAGADLVYIGAEPPKPKAEVILVAKTMGLPEAVIASYLDHRPPTAVTPVSAETAARQQQTADLFYENKLVPKKVDIRARIWQPTATQGAKS